jgi:amino-acid N-acetyltransferase
LVCAMEHEARRRGIAKIYLLTTTAEGYFENFGFQRLEMGKAPSALFGSAAFKGARPATAVLMERAFHAAKARGEPSPPTPGE